MWRRRVTRGLVLGCLILLFLPTGFAQNFAGFIERPFENAQDLSGIILVQGWALDLQAISRVDIYVDDQFVQTANINLPRADVTEIYPDWPGIQQRLPGFSTGLLASRFTNGPHTIHAVVVTDDNRSFEIGRRTININNSVNQPPFGYVEIPSSLGIYDANGSFPVSGWVTDTDGIARVDIVIDNVVYQSAVYGDARPDVYNAFPDFPASMFSAFIAHVDSSRMTDGVHTLVVRAKDRLGLSRNIGTRTIQVFNTTNNLRPFGFLDEPRRDATLYGTLCGPTAPPPPISPLPPPFIPTAHITPVRGWALDIGTRIDTGRVAYAELMVDGVPWVSTNDCEFSTFFGQHVNCYGIPRFDVARYYPTYPDAPRSGFFFTLDVGLLMNLGVRPGHHWIKVKVGDVEQTFAEIPNSAGIPVTFQCVETANLDFASRGFIDFPQNMDFVSGTVLFQGWATDENSGGIRQVEIWVDGTRSGFAQTGFPRPDVAIALPTVPGAANSGWRFSFDTRQLSDSRHRLTVVAVDAAGNRVTIGSSDFYVDNPD